MNDQAFIFADPARPDEVSWLTPAAATAQRGTWQEAAAAGRRAVVFLSTAEVSLLQVTVPSRNRRQIAAAVPFLLEEQVAADVERLHFACGERAPDGSVAVAVVDKERFQSWLARAKEAGIEPLAVVPAALALPCEAGGWTVLVEPDACTLRTGAESGFAIDPENLVWMLRRTLEEAAEQSPSRLRVIVCDGAMVSKEITQLGVPVEAEGTDASPLALFAQQYNARAPLNLLQGEFSSRERMGRMWRPYRAAAIMAAVWLAAQFGIHGFEYHRLSKENEALTESVAQTYLQTFPGARKVVNARAQMEQRLTALRGGGGRGGFIDMLGAVSPLMSVTNGVELQRLNYHEGELGVSLFIPDLQKLEEIKTRIAAAAPVSVEVESAAARDNKVEARLRIKRTAS